MALVTLWVEGGFLPIYAADGSSVRVIDGDSLSIGDRDIRLAGYDAPEYRQMCSTADGWPWPCGQAARLRLKEIAREGRIACEVKGRDRYGRALAACSTEAGDIGAMMVRDGLGLQTRRPPSTRYAAEEAEARAAKRGVWQGEHQHPAEYRDEA